jgi:hypothetical protein
LASGGQRYSQILGINVSQAKRSEVFKWFLASILFGAPIRDTAAVKTYRKFEDRGILTPKRIVETGWDGLVKILDEGGYARYDFKTADKLLEVVRNLIAKYDGDLNTLHEASADADELESRLKALGKGVGDVTVSIFLRELRGIWSKANPKPTGLVILAAQTLGIVKEKSTPEEALLQLEEFWKKHRVLGKSFVDFETALFRKGREIRSERKSRA